MPESNNCPDCGTTVAPQDAFCRECGRKTSNNCPNCGTTVAPQDAFCPECGQTTKPETTTNPRTTEPGGPEQPGGPQAYPSQPGYPGPQGHPGYPGQNIPAPIPQQPYGVQPQYGHPTMPVARKDPAVMLIASFFVPGLGTLLNGEGGKGAAILIGWFFSWMFFWLLSWILIGFFFIPVAMVLWIWGMVDAFVGAKNFNIRNGYPF
jgi:TM2 domain-containing membrane protein YozV